MNTFSLWIWIINVFLLLASFCFIYGTLFWLWPAALVLILVVRFCARRSEAHSVLPCLQWQMNTIWLELAIWTLIMALMIAVGYWMDSDGRAMAQLDALASSSLAPLDALKQMWNIPGIKALLFIGIVGFIVSILWPLKRTVHAMLALRSGRTPYELGTGGGLAAGIALLLLVASFCLGLLDF